MMDAKQADKIVAELEALKLLAVLDLVSKGFKQSQIAAAIGVSDTTLSTMFPKGLLKEAKKLSSE
jgi:predicted DNA-binding protein (UPF0251 family)